jgi:hypothetical protein
MSTSAAAVSTPAAAEHKARPALLVGALGVVFGDIGTSPIYAFRESLRAAGGAAAQATVLGILSLVFWAIVLVVALKYVMFVMRADNQGEGGTMALISLALPAAGRLRNVLLTIGLGGASLFFGDAMITPAISVLSAIEGVQIATPALKPYVVPVAAGVLIAVFAIQSRGSGRVGRLFRAGHRGVVYDAGTCRNRTSRRQTRNSGRAQSALRARLCRSRQDAMYQFCHLRARARGSCYWAASTQALQEMVGVRPMRFSAVRIAARS